jgi:hypothetical protein
LRCRSFAAPKSRLKKIKHPVLPKVDLLEIQSKLSRSTALLLLAFAALFVAYNWILAVFLVPVASADNARG